ncbi:MAG: HNH endonuclease signature motif containing protein, partial [Paraclostridium sp.]
LKNIYKRATFEELSDRMKERYKGYNPKLYKIDGIVIVPTYAQKYKRLMNFSQKTNSYTTEGRYFIHDELEIIDRNIIKEIKDSYDKLKSIEYNDNRISKFISQYGRCAISNTPLQNKDWYCHHIKLKQDGGTDRYRNLTVIKSDIHDAIHSSNTDNIKNIMSKYKLDKNQKRRFDKLRLEINLKVYYGCL